MWWQWRRFPSLPVPVRQSSELIYTPRRRSSYIYSTLTGTSLTGMDPYRTVGGRGYCILRRVQKATSADACHGKVEVLLHGLAADHVHAAEHPLASMQQNIRWRPCNRTSAGIHGHGRMDAPLRSQRKDGTQGALCGWRRQRYERVLLPGVGLTLLGAEGLGDPG